MRILRHEAGHAICNAFRLHYRPRWREVFGRFSTPYPATYQPDPASREYVLHLDRWYAQSHPAEDFAETFAVWLTPRSDWRVRYRHWPALAKLDFVDELMRDIAGVRPPVRTVERVEPLEELRYTLREHYQRKRARFAHDDSCEIEDHALREIFPESQAPAGEAGAARFLIRNRRPLRHTLADIAREHPYAVEQTLHRVIRRSRQLHLTLARIDRESRPRAVRRIAAHMLPLLRRASHQFAL
jgi:hypothetical protein